MNQENNIDELDKMLFDFFDSNKDVPNYINETIHNTLQKEKKQRNSFNIMKKVAMIIISFGIISTSFVFADDIINFITSLFTNSTEAIDSAIENGYIQNVNMDFVYYNDIGVKVDALVLDDTNLDISFAYNYQGKEQINSLELYEYTIKDENNNILYELSDDKKDELIFPLYISRYNETVLIEDNIYKDSVIYTSRDFSNIEKLKFEIKKFKTFYNEKSDIISGTWNIEVNLNEIFREKKNEFYSVSYNKYINNSKIELTETSLKISLEFNTLLEKEDLKKVNAIILKDNLDKEYFYNILNLQNNLNTSSLFLEYDISKFYNNIDILTLIININGQKIELKLEK